MIFLVVAVADIALRRRRGRRPRPAVPPVPPGTRLGVVYDPDVPGAAIMLDDVPDREEPL